MQTSCINCQNSFGNQLQIKDLGKIFKRSSISPKLICITPDSIKGIGRYVVSQDGQFCVIDFLRHSNLSADEIVIPNYVKVKNCNLKAKNSITIKSKASLENSKIKSGNGIVINGDFKGDAKSKKYIDITASSRVEGTFKSENVSILSRLKNSVITAKNIYLDWTVSLKDIKTKAQKITTVY